MSVKSVSSSRSGRSLRSGSVKDQLQMNNSDIDSHNNGSEFGGSHQDEISEQELNEGRKTPFKTKSDRQVRSERRAIFREREQNETLSEYERELNAFEITSDNQLLTPIKEESEERSQISDVLSQLSQFSRSQQEIDSGKEQSEEQEIEQKRSGCEGAIRHIRYNFAGNLVHDENSGNYDGWLAIATLLSAFVFWHVLAFLYPSPAFCDVTSDNLCDLMTIDGDNCYPCPKQGICQEGALIDCQQDFTAVSNKACVTSNSHIEQKIVKFLIETNDILSRGANFSSINTENSHWITAQELMNFSAPIDSNFPDEEKQIEEHLTRNTVQKLLSMMDESNSEDLYCMRRMFALEGNFYDYEDLKDAKITSIELGPAQKGTSSSKNDE